MKKLLSFITIFVLGIALGVLISLNLNNTQAADDPTDYSTEVVARFGNTLITRDTLAEYAIYQGGGKRLFDGELRDYAIVKNAATARGITANPEEVQKMYEYSLFFAEGHMVKGQLARVPMGIMMPRMESLVLMEKMFDISATDREAKQYYDITSSFVSPDQAHVIWISANSLNRADTARKLILEGDDPREVAADYNDNEYLKSNRGDVGWRTRNTFNPTVAEAIFDANNERGLKKGDVTNVITLKSMESGEEKTEYLLFYVVDIDRMHKRPYDTVKDAAHFFVRMQKVAYEMPQFFLDEIEKYNWSIKDDLFNANSDLVKATINTDSLREQALDHKKNRIF